MLAYAFVLSALARIATLEHLRTEKPASEDWWDTETKVRKTEYGPIKGIRHLSGREMYLSIPFAAPPTGENRFRAPQPHKGWTDVKKCEKDAIKFQCTQDITGGNEDCLYLDVHVPKGSENEKLPVWFWIYGGGFVTGSKKGFDGIYDPTVIMNDHRVVFVAINYRLGTLGFLAHPALEEESANGKVSGNYGLLDQNFALQWVKKNIANFNGDPNNVMVFGQSAGGMSVEFHVVSPASKGLLKSAVIMSGPPDVAFWQPKKVANEWAIEWTKSVGCQHNTTEEIRQCLRGAKRSKVTGAKIPVPSNLSILYPMMGWMPNVDGYYLTGTPVDMVNAGNWNKVPTMFGVEKNEGSMFVLGTPAIIKGFNPLSFSSVKHIAQQFYPYNKTKQDLVYNHYAIGNYWIPTHAAEALYTDGVIRCGTRRMLRAIAKQNIPTAPTFYYYTNFVALTMTLYNALGDFHGMDMIHAFGFNAIVTAIWTPFDDWLGQYLRSSYYEFGEFGTPGDKNWKKYTLEEEKGVYMNVRHPAQNMNKNDKECDFWDSLGANMWEGKYDYEF